MELPTIEELMERKTQRKKNIEMAFGGLEIHKIYFKNNEKKFENFINDHIVMLEKSDQELSYGINNYLGKLNFFSFLPPLSLGYFFYRFTIDLKIYYKVGLVLLAFAPLAYVPVYTSRQQKWLKLYLVDKYHKRIEIYEKNPRIEVINEGK
jgi:hypothetical protein